MNVLIREGCVKITKNVRGLFFKSEHKAQQCDAKTSGRTHSKFRKQKTKRPKEPDISSTEKSQESSEKEQESFLHESSCHSEPGKSPHSPEREVSDTSPEPVQLKSEAQHQHPPPSPRPSRTKTFNSIRSVGASSIRSVASGFKKLVCLPQLTKSEPQLPHHPQGRSGRAQTDLESRSRGIKISEKARDHNALLPIVSEESVSKTSRHYTFPLDRPTTNAMSTAQAALSELRTKLQKRRETSENFNHIWENEALPHLRGIMTTDYSISIQAEYGETRVRRIVEVMTEKELPYERNRRLKDEVSKIFEESPFLRVEISFTVGNIKRSTGTEDNWVPPGNPHYHFPMMMGDSVGYQNGNSAATIGPALESNGKIGCLVNYHLFHGVPQLEGLQDDAEIPDCRLVHPAAIDCAGNDIPRPVGKLRAHSGSPMYNTQRQSQSLGAWFPQIPKDELNVQTDWAFCDLQDDGTYLQNCIRYAPSGREFQEHSGLISHLIQGDPRLRIVRCSGRTSGIRYAIVCETPAAVCQNGTATREWYLENISDPSLNLLSTEGWNAGGVGIPGDSGAAIIDDETRELIGQVWGRNVYAGNRDIRRIAYFTHIHDIFDDIKERYPDMKDVKLANVRSVPDSSSRPHGAPPGQQPRVTFSPTIQVSHHGVQRSSYQRPAPAEHLLHTSTSKNSLTSSTSSGITYIDPSHAGMETGLMDKETGIAQILVTPPSRTSIVN